MKNILTLLFLVIAGFSYAADPVQHRSASEVYTDPDLKISFPANAGSFRKNEVSRSYNPMIGTKIRYSDPSGLCAADIYIYASPDGENVISDGMLKKHYEELKSAILGLPGKGLSLKKVSLTGEKKRNLKGLQVYSADFQMTWEDGLPQSSSLYLFSYKGKIVKLRISGAGKEAEAFSGMILKIFSNR